MISPAQRRQLVLVIVVDVLLSVAQHFAVGGTVFGPPAPFATDAPALFLRVETSDTLPKEQDTIAHGHAEGTVLDWCKKNGVKVREIDKDNTDMQYEDAWVKSAFEATKDKPTPWIAFSNGKNGYSEPMAANSAHELERLAPYGGKP